MANYISKKSVSICICMVALLPALILQVNSQQYPGQELATGISGLSTQFLLSVLRGLPRDPPVCNFRCPIYGQFPTPREGHVARYNGCGSYGFERLLVPEMDFFVECCNAHDLCYDSCGASKIECDYSFHACLLERCQNIYQNYALIPNVAANCMSTAQLLGTGPVVAGCNPFIIAQTNSCDCTF